MHDNRFQPGESRLPKELAGPKTARAALDLLWVATEAEAVGPLAGRLADLLIEATESRYIAIVGFRAGEWNMLGEAGRRQAAPPALGAEALDRETIHRQEDWIAAPLRPRAAGGELLLVLAPAGAAASQTLAMIEALARVVGQALDVVRARRADHRRIERLKTILEITSEWNQSQEMESLLVDMAEAATTLLESDRASIFLWDRNSRTLVGRPALGVEGGELRIPDDAGVVGQVVQTGETRRVDLAGDQQQINRQVDAKLGYQTNTLLCAPLRSRAGEIFGAFEMINKLEGNFTDDDEQALLELAAGASVALENTRERERLLTAQRQLADQMAEGIRLIGQSPAIEALRGTIRRVANTELAILVLGEHGAGKEVVSQSIHYLSDRRDRPLVSVNCAAITETLLESELFGHEKGAFTDAHETRAGKFELASGGTIFLDEIGDLSLGGQAKLLRVLEEKIVVRVGGSTPIHTDARVVAATNQNLAELVRQKRFREDLYFRLNVVSIELPPLRERGDDVVLLAEHFLNDFSRKAGRPGLKLSAAARRRLESHAWPGNVRELRNLMERMAYLSQGDRIEADDLAFILAPHGGSSSAAALEGTLSDATNSFQGEFIEAAIRRAKGNMSEAADRLGLHRSNLYRKMRQLGMRQPEES